MVSSVNLNVFVVHALWIFAESGSYLDRTVRWLSVVACWLNGQGLRLELGLGLWPGNALAVLFFPLVYKCGEHLCLRWLCIQSPLTGSIGTGINHWFWSCRVLLVWAWPNRP